MCRAVSAMRCVTSATTLVKAVFRSMRVDQIGHSTVVIAAPSFP